MKSILVFSIVPCWMILASLDIARAQVPPDNTFPNPTSFSGRVGIGTWLLPLAAAPEDLLHLYGVEYSPAGHPADEKYNHPALRISLSPQAGPEHFGQLAMENSDHYSALSQKYDFVLRASASAGNLLISDRKPDASIRITTTPDSTQYPMPGSYTLAPWGDEERITVAGNGNVGINIPPDGSSLCTPTEQLQIGGGVVASGSYHLPIPGLAIYGGNRWEGMQKAPPAIAGETYPVVSRWIGFNLTQNHNDGHLHRIASMPSCRLNFSESQNGLMQFDAFPIHSNPDDFSRGMSLNFTSDRLTLFYDRADGDPLHNLFYCNRAANPADPNDLGKFVHNSRVYIGCDSIDPTETNTYMLAVKGYVKAQDVFVTLNGWPDYVFSPQYRLPSLPSIEEYIASNHHLPEMPSADEVNDKPLKVGDMEQKLLGKIEELTLYVISLKKENDALRARMDLLDARH